MKQRAIRASECAGQCARVSACASQKQQPKKPQQRQWDNAERNNATHQSSLAHVECCRARSAPVPAREGDTLIRFAGKLVLLRVLGSKEIAPSSHSLSHTNHVGCVGGVSLDYAIPSLHITHTHGICVCLLFSFFFFVPPSFVCTLRIWSSWRNSIGPRRLWALFASCRRENARCSFAVWVGFHCCSDP